ncbi:asparagine synthase (glutamine-hydrolyzing) [soil metagenome]
MCGIAGCLSGSTVTDEVLHRLIDAIRHRGPDDVGTWADGGVGLAHARLSIIDLSPTGHQPMNSPTGRFAIAFNGEIYNYTELRAELMRRSDARKWRGHSDTEILLAAFEDFGIEAALKKAVGMFALAVWDRQERTLTIARDRLGEKPLHYGWQGGTFVFGSEMKALRSHPDFRARIDRRALGSYMRHSYVPAPYTIYEGISKLMPGTCLTVSLADRNAAPRAYWDLQTAVSAGLANPFAGSANDAVNELETLLSVAVKGQMAADVPLGAFLSGGIDSSLIVALMQAQSSRPIRTFTIGFDESAYNEAVHAKAIAQHLGTDHTELYVQPQQALDVIPRLPTLYSEPFADSSQIPTFLVSQLARQHVTVSLSGDAGDELFAGYNRYVLGKSIWGRVSPVPASFRAAAARLVSRVPASRWNSMLAPIQGMLPAVMAQANIGDKMIKAAGVVGARTQDELYRLLVSQWANVGELVVGGEEHTTLLDRPHDQPRTDGFVHRMMALDLLTYLPDDILVKVDRAAMGVSLETRVPFLDHRVVEFAWRLPVDYKLRGGVSKWPLRQILYKHVPRALIERPKMGFGVPIDSWLRGPLRDWAEDLLNERRLQQEGYLTPKLVRRKWEEHLSGARNWQHQIWNVLMWQAWLAEET